MRTFINCRVREGGERISKICILIFLFVGMFTTNVMADQGPSLENLKRNAKAAREEQQKIAHEEFMSYIYMSVGFAVVIAIAWFSTVAAKKSKAANDLAKANRVIKHAHDPYKRSSTSHKPRR